jgi:hypothetical protein
MAKFNNFIVEVTLIAWCALLLASPAVAASSASLQAMLSGANEVNARGDPNQTPQNSLIQRRRLHAVYPPHPC